MTGRMLADDALSKFKHLKGEILYLYNEDALRDADEVVLCEGPVDTITAEQFGNTAVERVEFLVAGLGKLNREFTNDNVLGEIFVVKQAQAFEVLRITRYFAAGFIRGVTVLAVFGGIRKLTAEGFDQSRPVLIDNGAQTGITDL